ncbi:MAG: hypothetical protein RLZZ226_315 [Pseudomonadota bacterium]|jgi:hypothetical protein
MTGLNRWGACHHNEVKTFKAMLAKTKTLTDDSFDPVAISRLTNLFSGNRKTQPGREPTIGSGQDGQVAVCRFGRLVKNMLEIPRIIQTQ